MLNQTSQPEKTKMVDKNTRIDTPSANPGLPAPTLAQEFQELPPDEEPLPPPPIHFMEMSV